MDGDGLSKIFVYIVVEPKNVNMLEGDKELWYLMKVCNACYSNVSAKKITRKKTREGNRKGLESLGYLVWSGHPSCFYTSVGTKRTHANNPKGKTIIVLKI
jgi:hypothetical protein